MKNIALSLTVAVALIALSVPIALYAQSVDELRGKIDEQQQSIQELEAEIEQYEQELVEIGAEKQTLQSAVRELDVSRQKVNANITLAQRKINSSSATIAELESDINEKESRIANNQHALAETLRRMDEAESASFIEILLNSDNISSVWTGVETIQQFQVVVQNEVVTLGEQREELLTLKTQSEAEQAVVVDQKTELANQRQALDINRRAKNTLLEETASEEAAYQSLLEEKQQAKEEFEAQLRDFEAQLQFKLDPNSIPPAGQGVFRWPLDNVTITQYFGNTRFAQSGAYSGSGHNGIDFRAAIGTPVKSVLSGNVRATGNTDAIRGCFSYGKWVLVEHVNGLTTLYAHLSDINVSPGEPVATGQTIGYSGNTGFSTGPHLHLTVYAADAVEVVRLGDIKTRTNCADARIPVAAWEGYLNPLDFLES